MKLKQIIAENDQPLDYTGINPEIRNRLENYKPHFQQWAIAEINDFANPESVIDAIEYYQSKIKDNRFQEILSKLTPAPKNILTLSLEQLKTAQSQYDEKYNRTSKRELRKQLKQNYVEILLDTPQWKIIKIEKTDGTDGAAKILSEYARGTKWCVTDPRIGNSYLLNGPLYVIFKDDIKYALCHVESQQLMDISDREIEIKPLDYELLSPYIPNIGLFTDKSSYTYRETIKKIPKLAYGYALIIGDRWLEAEPYIMKDPKVAYRYAKDLIHHRWPEAEPYIMKDPKHIFYYARYIIGGRWPEAEPYILNDPVEYAYYYAEEIIGGRWPEAEPYIVKDPDLATNYAIDILGRRWPEAEDKIKRSISATRYAKHFGIDLSEFTKQ